MAIFTLVGGLIAGAIGLGGATLFGVSVGSLIGGALAFGTQLGLAYLNRPKKRAYSAVQGQREYGARVPATALYGTGKMMGHHIFYAKYGAGNKYNADVFVLANGWCDGLEPEIYFYGQKHTLVPRTIIGNEVAHYGVDGFDNLISIRFYDGRPGQGPDTKLVSDTADLGQNWKATSVCAGMAYVVVEREWSEAKFDKGQPDFEFVFRGLRLYDPRKDSTITGGSGPHRPDDPSTWQFSKNPALQRLNYQLGLRGLVSGRTLIGEGKSLGQLDLGSYFAAMNACDALRNGNPTYEASLLVTSDDDHTEVLKEFDDAMAGYGMNRRGLSGVIPGAPQLPVLALGPDDIDMGRPKSIKHRKSAFDLYNQMSGQYISTEANWTPASLDPIVVNTDVNADGRTRQIANDFLQVTSADIAQYLLQIRYRQQRKGGSATVPVSRRAGFQVQEGEWITYAGKTWLVTNWSCDEELQVTLTLAETGSDVYSSAGIEPGPIVIPPTPPVNPSLIFTVSNFRVTGGLLTNEEGTDIPVLRFEWDAPSDPSVTEVRFQYRYSLTGGGFSEVQSDLSKEPEAGFYTTSKAVASEKQYFARASITTVPDRLKLWTPWTASPTLTGTLTALANVLDGSITSDKLADAAVTAAKIQNEAVTAIKLADEAVTESKIAVDAVTQNVIKAGSINLTKFASGIEPVGVISSGPLPTVKTTENINWQGKLYHWDGTKYSATVDASDISGLIDPDQLAIEVGGTNLLQDSGFLKDTGYWAINNGSGSGAGRGLRYETPGRGFGRWAVATAGATPGTNLGVRATTAFGLIQDWKPNSTYMVSFWAKTNAGSSLLGSVMRFIWGTSPASTVVVENPPLTTTEQLYVFKITWGGSVEPTGRVGFITGSSGTMSTGAEVWVANPQVEEGNTLTSYAPRVGEILPGTITAAEIAPESVEITKFASGLRPIEIVSTLPTTGNFAGRTVFLTTDSKLYRHSGTPAGAAGYTAAVASVDIAGQIEDTQIADSAVTRAKIADGALNTAKFASDIQPVGIVTGALPMVKSTDVILFGSELYRWDGSQYSKAIDAADISGIIPSDQLAIEVGGTNRVVDSGFLTPPTSATTTGFWNLHNNSGSGAGRSIRLETPGRGFGNWIVATAGATPGTILGINNVPSGGIVGGWVAQTDYTISFYAQVPAGSPLLGRTMRTTWNTAPTITVLQNPPLTTDAQRYVFKVKWSGASVESNGRLYLSIDNSLPPATGDEIWITNVQVEEGNTLTGYAPRVGEILPGTIGSTEIADGSIVSGKINDGTLTTAKFASGLRPVEVVSSLPATGNVAGRTVYLTTDGKLYRHTGSPADAAGFTATVPSTDISGQIANAQIETIDAAKITSQIVSTQIEDDAITTPKIAAGAIVAGKIDTGAVTATKMLIAETTNMIPDASFEDAAAWVGAPFTVGSVSWVAPVPYRDRQLTIPAGEVGEVTSLPFGVEGGVAYLFSGSASSSTNGNALNIARVDWFNQSDTKVGEFVALSSDLNSSVTNRFEQVVTAPATASTARVVLRREDAGTGAANARFAGLVFRRAASGSLIVDGSITAAKVDAASVRAAILVADSITSGMIQTGAIKADQIDAGAVTASKLLISDSANLYLDYDLMDQEAYTSDGADFEFNGSSSSSSIHGRNYLTINEPGEVYTPWFAVWGGRQIVAKSTAYTVNTTGGTTSRSEIEFAQVAANGNKTITRRVLVGERTNSTSTGLFTAFIQTAGAENAFRFVLSRIGGTSVARSGGYTVNLRANAELIVDGAITTDKLDANAVTASKIDAGAVTASKIDAGAVTTEKMVANSINGDRISAGTLNASKITAGSITTDRMTANSINGDRIAAGTLDADKITANSITSGQIQAGAIGTTELAAESVTASRMFVGDTANMIPDNAFRDPDAWSGVPFTLGTFAAAADVPYRDRHLQIASSQTGTVWTQPIGCDGDSPYWVSGSLWSTSAGNARLRVFVEWSDLDGVLRTDTVQDTTTSSTLTGKYGQLLEAPAGASYVRVGLDREDAGTGSGSARFIGLVLRRAVTGSLVVDGSITADKIGANQISAAQIDAASVRSAVLVADSIATGMIQAGAIKAAQIDAGAVTATKVVIGDASNLYPDYDLADPDFYSSDGASYTRFSSTLQNLGARGINMTTNGEVYTGWAAIDVNAALLVVGTTYNRVAAADRTGTLYIEFGTFSTSGGGTVSITRRVQVATRTNSTATAVMSINESASLNEDRFRFVCVRSGSGSGSGVRFGGFAVFRRAASSLIVDGAITAIKIDTGAVTADKIFAGAVTTAKLDAGAVTAAKIGAGEVQTSHMTANSISGTVISAGTLNASKITANSITSGQIQAGAIGATEIAAKAITAEQLAITSFDNLVPNPGFYDGTNHSWASWPSECTVVARDPGSVTALQEAPTAYVGRFVGGGAQVGPYSGGVGQYVECKPGDQFYFSLDAARNANSNYTASTFGFRRYWMRNDGTVSTGSTYFPSLAQTWSTIEFTGVAPANTVGVRVRVIRLANDDPTIIYFTNVTMKAVKPGVLIQNGAITAGKIEAGSITGSKIEAGSITTSHMNVGSIAGDRIAANTLAGDRLVANSITARELVLVDFDNQIPDKNLTQPDLWSGVAASFLSSTWSAPVPFNTHISIASGVTGELRSVPAPAAHNAAYAFTGTLSASASNNARGIISIEWLNGGSVVRTDTVKDTMANSTTGNAFNYLVTSPANAEQFRVVLRRQAGSGGDTAAMRFIGLVMRRAVNANLIVDGTITGDKLNVNNLEAVAAKTGTLEINESIVSTNGKLVINGGSSPYIRIST